MIDFNLGLSPLARGTHRINSRDVSRRRFIPAGAGNSVDGEFFIAGAPVYPRWRGELHAHDLRIYQISGLSPLARGTL